MGGGLKSIEAVGEIGELVRKTNHVDPYTERNIRSNDVIMRFSLKNKGKQIQSSNKQT